MGRGYNKRRGWRSSRARIMGTIGLAMSAGWTSRVLYSLVTATLKYLAEKKKGSLSSHTAIATALPYAIVGIMSLLGHKFVNDYLWKPSKLQCNNADEKIKIQGKDVCMSVAVDALTRAKQKLKSARRNARRRRAGRRRAGRRRAQRSRCTKVLKTSGKRCKCMAALGKKRCHHHTRS